MNAQESNPFDNFEMSPQETIDLYKNNQADPTSNKNPFDEFEFGEGFWKNAFRTALQIPQGIAEGTKYGIGTGLFQMLALGESDLGIEEWHKLRELAEQEGIPFDEEAYETARGEMLGMIPTVSNIGRKIESETGLPLEPKTWYQNMMRLGSMATKLAPNPGTLRPLNVKLPAPVIGAGVATAAEVGKQVLPEPIADIGSLLLMKGLPPGAAGIEIGAKQKPSGLSERGFEKVTKPKEVSESKLGQINQKVESDFREISDKIIAESPIGETAVNLKNDPTFMQESRELLNQAQAIANEKADIISAKSIKKEIIDISAKETKGFAQNEYDKNYNKFVKEGLKDIKGTNVSSGQLVEQYRKNNEALGEYFEPGSSKALNRAKRDALLDQNRAIANTIEKTDPELAKVFKEGNERWTKIKDTEAVDSLINEMFEGKINYNKVHDFFDKTGYDRIFKRALGEKGYKNFEGLLKDLLESETPYKMLKIAKDKGYSDLFKTGLSYVIDPNIAKAKVGFDLLKSTHKKLINFMLDKPQVGITWKKAMQNLKKGNFKESEKAFEKLDKEIKVSEKPKETLSKKAEDLKTFSQGGMGKAMMENFYQGIFESLEKGKNTFSGVKDPLLIAAKPAFDAGQIKTVEDLKKFAEFWNKQKITNPKTPNK